jgi:hypothetical protein
MDKQVEEMEIILFHYYFELILSCEGLKIFELKHKIGRSPFLALCFFLKKNLTDIILTQAQVIQFCRDFSERISKNDFQPVAVLLDNEKHFTVNIYKQDEVTNLSVSGLDNDIRGSGVVGQMFVIKG